MAKSSLNDCQRPVLDDVLIAYRCGDNGCIILSKLSFKLTFRDKASRKREGLNVNLNVNLCNTFDQTSKINILHDEVLIIYHRLQ